MLPFRGGIAQYNTLLCRALGGSPAVRFFSFTRQYPTLLYPGNDDKDPTQSGHSEPGVLYTIDSLNPITWWRTARQIARLDPSIVFFHWWTFFWAPCFMVMCWLLKRRRLPIGVVCHNIADHDASSLKAAISRRFLRLADAFLVHSPEHAEILRREFPGRTIEYHPIPVYGHYPKPLGRLAKRGRLELLFFGFIRPYKGLDVLLDAMRLVNDQSVHLTVVGEHWGDATGLEKAASTQENVELHLRYMSDQDAAEYFDRADFIVLPYKSPTPSAVASLSYHYDKPIIASRVTGLSEIVAHGQSGLLTDPCNPGALADTIRHASRDQALHLADGVRLYKQTHGWESLLSAFDRLVDQSGR